MPKGVKADQIDAPYQHDLLELTTSASPELMDRKIPVDSANKDRIQLQHQAFKTAWKPTLPLNPWRRL